MAYYYDVNALKKYVAENAPKYGLDPATALKVWTGEGLSEGTWQSRLYQNGKREESYGPFQLNMNPGAMGDRFMKATGLDPRDPKNVYAMADYAMAHAGKHGWGEWFAARDQDIGPWQGITRGVSQGTGALNLAGAGSDDPSILPQVVGGFQFPHAPNLDPLPGLVQVVSAAGAPPSTTPNAEGTGLLAKIFGGVGKQPEPYWMKGKGWDAEAKKAYLAQNLENAAWPSLKSFLS